MEDILKIDEKYLGDKRKDYLPLEATFMATAIVWAGRSKDPSTQVGACYVNEKGRIISVGYNGSPNKWDDDVFPWGKDISNGEKNTKYPYVIHAEMNGILNYDGSSSDFENSVCYVTLFPCSNCAKFLVQRGVKKIVYLCDKYKNKEDNIEAKILLKACNVEYVKYSELHNDVLGLDLSLEEKKAEDPIKIKRITYKNNEEK